MEMALTFNQVTFSPVQHRNSLWIRSVELARALGYKDESSVRRIYERNADEFTPDMTQVIEMSDTVNLTVPPSGDNSRGAGLRIMARIFSLRGCHLLAMFARTPIAKEFRKWVLDVLDKLAEAERAQACGKVKENPEASRLSTPASRKPLRALVSAWAQISGTPHTALWPQVKAHFQLERIDDLPEEWLPDALDFVQEKIDSCAMALPQADKQPLPLANGIEAAPELALSVAALDAKTYASGKSFFDDVLKLRHRAECVREAMHLFCRPGGVSASLSQEKQALYDNANEAANVAVTALNQAIYALRMVYNIKGHVRFSQ